MPENELDPSGSTQEFRAFMAESEPETARRSPSRGLIIAAAIIAAVVVIIAVVALAG